MFIPNKAAWYASVLQEAKKVFNVQGTWYWPYVEGGGIYLIAQKLFAELPFRANDGKAWEASVGLILGKAFNCYMYYADGLPILPSGITFTSMYGTLAMMIANRNTDPNGNYINLGDDLNYYGKLSDISSPIVEFQPEDTSDLYMLGVSYKKSLAAPRVIGLKATADRSTLAKSLPLKKLGREEPIPLDRKLDERIVVAWAGLPLGRFGKRTLIESLKGIPPGEYISPGELLEQHTEEKAIEDIDPFAWAEEFGVKKLFVGGES